MNMNNRYFDGNQIQSFAFNNDNGSNGSNGSNGNKKKTDTVKGN